MSDRSFIDTNVLIYAYDLEAGSKHTIAANILRDLWLSGSGALSTQVLQEFYVNVTKKSQGRSVPERFNQSLFVIAFGILRIIRSRLLSAPLISKSIIICRFGVRS